jgi:hypothetical protein
VCDSRAGLPQLTSRHHNRNAFRGIASYDSLVPVTQGDWLVLFLRGRNLRLLIAVPLKSKELVGSLFERDGTDNPVKCGLYVTC